MQTEDYKNVNQYIFKYGTDTADLIISRRQSHRAGFKMSEAQFLFVLSFDGGIIKCSRSKDLSGRSGEYRVMSSDIQDSAMPWHAFNVKSRTELNYEAYIHIKHVSLCNSARIG